MRSLTSRITYLNTASFAIYLIPSAIKYRRLGRFGNHSSPSGQAGSEYGYGYSALSTDDPIDRPSSPVAPAVGRSPRSMTHALPQTTRTLSQSRRHRPSFDIPARPSLEAGPEEGRELESGGTKIAVSLPKLTVRETAQVAAWWAAAWFLANWTVNASLALTSVASVSILSSTSGMSNFVYSYGRGGREL